MVSQRIVLQYNTGPRTRIEKESTSTQTCTRHHPSFRRLYQLRSLLGGLLEIQINTNELRLTHEVTNVECDIHFVKLTGFYSCLSGASLFLQRNTLEGTTTATLECSKIGYFKRFKFDHLSISTQE